MVRDESMLSLARLTLVGLFAVAGVHCNTGATGVDACREIESKKCELAVGCKGVALATANDVTACKLFYRDQCLHGIADGVDPAAGAVTACLAALDLAGACKGGSLASCAKAPALAKGVDATKVTGCSVLLASELLADCSFLAPAGGVGGAGGSGGSASTSSSTAASTAASASSSSGG
jgi:hypothetical protein